MTHVRFQHAVEFPPGKIKTRPEASNNWKSFLSRYTEQLHDLCACYGERWVITKHRWRDAPHDRIHPVANAIPTRVEDMKRRYASFWLDI